MIRGGATLAVTALLTGCATLAPSEPPPLELEPPGSWSAIAVAEPSMAGSIAADWWSTFDDEVLSDLIVEALANNHDLGAAAARVEAAVAQARIAGAALTPAVSANLTPSRRRQNFIGFPIPGGEGSVLSSTTTTYGANLNVDWEVDLWGRLRAGRSAALSSLRASEADYDAARLSLAALTAKTWFALVEAEQQVVLADATLVDQRSTRQRIERRYARGLRSALELRLARTNEYVAESNRSRRRQQREATLRQLEILLGRYPGGELRQNLAEAALPDAPPPVPAGLPAEILVRRPDLRAAESRLASAGFSVKESRAALYPRFSLTGSAGRLSGELDDLLESDFSVWSLAANLLQPVLQGGRLRGGVALSEAHFREIAESYAQAALRAFAEVETALSNEMLLNERENALRAAATEAVASRDLAEDRYNAGLVDYLAVLTAQIQAQQTQSQLLSARRERLDTRVDLILALGGGLDDSSRLPALAAASLPSAPAHHSEESRP